MSVSLEPQLHDIVARVGLSAHLPYRSMAAFVRDAVIHRLWWLDQSAHADVDVQTAIGSFLSQMRMIDELDRIDAMVEMFEAFIDKMEKAFDAASRYGDWDVLLDSIAKHEEFWADMRDPYRTRALQVLTSYRHQVPVHYDPEDRM